MRTIAIVNQKGGCGKTTTAINLASVMARRGLRTLLVDMDPQAHCAAGLGVPERRIEYSIADALLEDSPERVDPARLLWEVARDLDLAPSTMRLAMLEAPGGGLHEKPDKDRRLEQVLQHVGGAYDCCLIDCPPTIGLLTFNALRAAREALIPVETGYFALKGAEKQWETIQRVIRHIGRPIACHIMPTLHDPDSELAQDILAALNRQFAGQIIPVVIREHQALREAASMGQGVIEYAPESEARADYEALADWLAEHEARPLGEPLAEPLVEPLVQIEMIEADDGAPPTPYEPRRREPAGAGAIQRAPGPIRTQAPDAAPPGLAPGPAPGAGSSRAGELVERLRRLSLVAQEGGGGMVGRRVVEPPATPATAAMAAVVAEIEGRPAECGGVEAAGTALSEPAEAASEVVHEAAGEAMREAAAVPAPAAVETLPPLVAEAPAPAMPAARPAPPRHLLGAHPTTTGVLFVQPSEGRHEVCVAGDFNNWTPAATRLRFNPQLGVGEAMVDIPPGRHQYRLVIDGRWELDPYNDEQVTNEHGERNSVVVVAAPRTLQ